MKYPYTAHCKECSYGVEVVTDYDYEQRLSLIDMACPSCGEMVDFGEVIDRHREEHEDESE